MKNNKFIRPMLLLLSMLLPFSTANAYDKDPIVFVHGYSGTTLINFTYMKGRFSSDGYPSDYLRTYDYNSLIGVKRAAEILRDKVNQAISATGKSKVDLVAHSMGGLAVRYYMQYLSGAAKVDDVVTIATPHKGTTLAYLDFFSQSGRDMRPGSAMLNSLSGNFPDLSLWSSCDEIVIPHTSPQVGYYKYAGCWEHNAVMLTRFVYDETKNHIK